ncbi:uncharacterized protein EV422DRAFT_540472 [Fimicolochytrium jonesii]|uniref:uncharacterized protein n=1 Tax=Fimicolochytrium jonesii TaxID=1396493 RepID=UPI0022FEFE80|nr:uncharacterized protein EV422DRAFT_540472 [Fimicolochytrium jonesii]KAI8817668.1 hypothetical protein EV422DRAFT_540472 [Fimicolochytrium jonesii]
MTSQQGKELEDDIEKGETDAMISDLAGASSKKEKLTRFPGFPMTILAPLLLIASLIAVLAPTFILLGQGSTTAVDQLSTEYLDALMQRVSMNITGSVKNIFPLVEYLTSMPRVAASFAPGREIQGLENEPWAGDLIGMYFKYNLDTIGCTQTSWIPPNGPGSPMSNATIHWTQMFTYPHPLLGNIIYKGDWSPSDDGGKVAVYMVNKKTLSFNASAPVVHDYLHQVSLANRMQLGDLEVMNSTYWNAYVSEKGTYVAWVTTPHFVASSNLPNYHCSAGIRVDSTWNSILLNNKPTDDSVVAFFNQNLQIVASSNMVATNTTVTSKNTFTLPDPDALTISLRNRLTEDFVTFENAATPFRTVQQYQDVQLPGYDGLWILVTQRVSISSYISQDGLLAVAIPRRRVYGTIEDARNRALRTSIGIAVAFAVLSSIVFVIIVMPLFKLAKVMQSLTTLNFAKLEESNALEERSVIWEIRRVQTVFATMVKAFAGGLKKNKALVAGRGTGTGTGSGKEKVATIRKK